MTLAVTLAQLPVHTGDLVGNRNRIIDAAEVAAADGAHILLTPELYLTGYPAEDLLLNPDFIDATRDELANLALHLPPQVLCAVGAPMLIRDLPAYLQSEIRAAAPALDAEPRQLVNALVLFQNGSEVGYIIKHLLPTYGVFDDARWFAPGPVSSPLVTVNGVNVGFAICEDVWADTVINALSDEGADVILVANASPYAEGKQTQRLRMLTEDAERIGTSIAYLNMVGGQDEVVYDGGSFVITPDGVAAQLPAFKEWTQTVTLDPYGHQGSVAAYPGTVEGTYLALVTGLRDYINHTHTPGVIIGLSGGLDSALAATIAVDALGADRVYGVAMPGPYSSQHSVDDAVALAENLKLTRFDILNISDTFHAERKILGHLMDGPGAKVAEENIQARLRALHLMTLANAHNLITLNTGNKSEASVGYFTLGGDSSGGFAILKDVYKTRAYELAEWRNRQAILAGMVAPIPVNTITKPPSAELAPDQQDTDSLPPYPVLDTILRAYLEDRAPMNVIIDRITVEFGEDTNPAVIVPKVITMVTRAEHKRRQVAPGVKVTNVAYGRDRRYPIVNAFTVNPSYTLGEQK